jgi:hypothetical protein
MKSWASGASASGSWGITLKSQKDRDGVEWITTDAVFDALDIPRLSPTPRAAKRLKGLMVELGWTPRGPGAMTSRGEPLFPIFEFEGQPTCHGAP